MAERVRAVPRPRRDISAEEQALLKKRHDERWRAHEARRRAAAERLEALEETERRDRYEFRLFPDYDEEGGFVVEERRYHLCRFLVPWCLARALTQAGCDFSFSVGRTAMRATAAKRCRWIALVLALAVGLAGASYVAWRRGGELHEILHSPCYVCRRNRAHFAPAPDDDTPWWRYRPHLGSRGGGGGGELAAPDREAMEESEEARRALSRYARYAHGEPCALSDSWVAAIDRELTGRWLNHSVLERAARAATPNPWLRYDRLWSGAVALSMWGGEGEGEGEAAIALEEDWRNALPRLWVVGFRGAGTTSLAHYLGAHPGIEVRREAPAPGDGAPVPWDDHFFAAVPHWAADEVRGWLRRGWGPPTLRDHQGRGRVRVEVGPDYLWHAATGAAGAVRRATSRRRGLFLVLLADPVRLAREAYERARASGTEERDSFADVVADELPALARCLWWDGATPAEQRERLLSGHCGGAEPGRVGPPYLWRGLLSEFLAHWMRTATPGAAARRHWYFVRAADLLHQPNRTLNRVAQRFLGLPAFDFGPPAVRAWHPPPPVVRRVAPEAHWAQSWRSYVPRAEYLRALKKTVADGLLEGAERAARRVVPGLEAGLAARDKLHRLHCRLAGYVDTRLLSTERCLRPEHPSADPPKDGEGGPSPPGARGKRRGRNGKRRGRGRGEAEEAPAPEVDEAQEREAQAEAALRDFYAPYQAQLMQLVDAIEDLRARFPLAWAEQQQQQQNPPPRPETGGEEGGESGAGGDGGGEEDEYEEALRKMYLPHRRRDAPR